MDCMTSLLFVTLFGAALSLPSSLNSAGVCNSKDCQDIAKIIKGNLDENADPCEDFYAFACGGFKKANPTSRQHIDEVDLIMEQLNARQVGLLDNPKLKNHGSKIVRKAKQIYDECMNGTLRENATKPLPGRVFVNQHDSIVSEGMYKSQLLKDTPEQTCRMKINSKYSFVIIRLYLDKYFPLAEHKAARNAIINIWKALRNDIRKKVSWLDDETEKNVNQGLDDLVINTGYPDWISDDKELDKEYEEEQHPDSSVDPLTVNAFFNRDIPEIAIPAGILHRQIFNSKIPNYINYGAAASIAGAKLSEGVDYWIESNNEGKKRANQCIISQAQTIKEPQTRHAYYRGGLILSEMLADIGGINASYTAYKTYARGQEEQLPGLTKYSADQLFFLAQANTWCANTDKYWTKYVMAASEHPYNYYRVVLTALNSPVFAKAYNCQARTRMNPTDKCILW